MKVTMAAKLLTSVSMTARSVRAFSSPVVHGTLYTLLYLLSTEQT
jgi:hypothetical protein